MRKLTSHQVRDRRFAAVAGQALLTRDTATAPTLDLELKLETATADQLAEQRTALLARLDNPEAGDDATVLVSRAAAVGAAITAHNARAAEATAARAALLGNEPTRTVNVPGAGQTPAATESRVDTPTHDLTLGRSFAAVLRGENIELGAPGVDSASVPEFRAWVQRAAGWSESAGKMGSSPGVVIPGEVRALFATTNFPSDNTRVPGVVQPDRDTPLTILDLVDRRPMTSQVVEWVQETGYPNAAAEVTEGTAKSESTFAMALVTSTAATIAHWVNITRQALSDETMLRGYIEGRMTYGLLRRLNAQILNGNGTAPNLRGILNTSGIGAYVAATATEAAVVSIRKAKTVAQLSEYEPDAVVLNPVDHEAVELSTDTTGAWRVVANAQSGPNTLWGLRVVVTTNITGTTFATTGGTFLVGNFREGATLWEREGVTIYITDSHASNFTSNILTLLAEMRGVLSVWRPKAFVKGTFGASRA